MRAFRSFDEARVAFARYAELEPRLVNLWELCEHAAPPVRAAEVADSDDAYDVDLYVNDPSTDDEGWCAEDFFYDHVKSSLLLLVGLHRSNGPEVLQTHRAFEEVHDLLLDWALHRPCPCCRDQQPHEAVGDHASGLH